MLHPCNKCKKFLENGVDKNKEYIIQKCKKCGFIREFKKQTFKQNKLNSNK